MTDPLFDLTGKVALVTGGTSGIGRMIARSLVARRVTTYITGRDPAGVDEAARALSGEGECRGLAADFVDPDAPHKIARDLALRESRLDLLVNNAGASEATAIDATTQPDWDLVLDVNLRAPFFLIQALLPLLRTASAAGGSATIINIGSIGGLHVPNWEAFPYGASKAAIHHLTRALAKRLGREGIRVNAIAPGPFPSRMTDTASDAVQKSLATYVPLGRAGTAEDIEGAVVFLASRAGAYVNGTTIPLDGGYIAAL